MKKYVILDTDWGGDVDDAIAARLLCNAHKKGMIEFIGCIIDAATPESVRSLDAFLLSSGLDLPIGIDREATDFIEHGRYQKHLLDTLPSKYKSEDEAEDGVRQYRKLLAASPEKVHIVAIGFTQVLANLLQSPPDEISPLSGTELVLEKVAHLWDMGGRWDGNGNLEYNFNLRKRAADGAHRLCAQWPTPITFLGYEIGCTVFTGNKLPDEDPLKQAIFHHGSADKGNASWDPMMALLCVNGNLDESGYDCVYGHAYADAETGACAFTPDPAGPHRYLIKKNPDSWYEDTVNAWLPWK